MGTCQSLCHIVITLNVPYASSVKVVKLCPIHLKEYYTLVKIRLTGSL